MPVNVTEIIGEVLGEPAGEMRNPANADNLCPYINSVCLKRSHAITGPYPICSIWRKRSSRHPKPVLICTCPKRFFEVDFLRDVITHCWPGPAPVNPQFVHEIKMEAFGNVDFVIADFDTQGDVTEFVSVELQAIDITGSVFPAYNALINSLDLNENVSYGFNYANVYKRFITQLIAKGFFHHHWGTKIAAVIQDVVYDYFQSKTPFPVLGIEDSNIVFLIYRYEQEEGTPARHKLVLDKVAPTHHSNLQTAVLYRTPPSKEVFCERIKAQARNG